ncbi:SAM-dependent methyltransferase [Agreia pratensis]|uniref:Methyltransferase domain-containing protein n=1 Tax=Agreia pratensis TaxID=150121 RepID=A0A1X7K7L4_9MICO|nr:class I SAM-dependent methyltransferase [Agreia pratensis]SMG37057.1 Methyltransferase domain-containing protein [Agreia pratensis]
MTDHEQQSPASFWESRYREADRAWSGRANAALEREAVDLAPGRALDLGSGEGGDALWLASRGWRVTAVDISPTALERGRAAADYAGLGERISWVEADLATWIPDGEFDLVSAHFLHSPVELPREAILRRAASAVAPSGVLLIVGHGAFPPWSTHRHEGPPLPGPDAVLTSLALPVAEWTVLTSAMVDRDAVSPSGEPVVMTDAVLTLRRAVSV